MTLEHVNRQIRNFRSIQHVGFPICRWFATVISLPPIASKKCGKYLSNCEEDIRILFKAKNQVLQYQSKINTTPIVIADC